MSSSHHQAENSSAGRSPVACFDVLFDREEALYFPEDDVTGNVKITLTQPLRLTNLRVLFRGRAKFEKASNSMLSLGRDAEPTKYLLDYFDKDVILVDRLPGKEDTGEFVLPAGEHMVPYTFPLPKQLMSSFEGKCGSIRYYCQAIISRNGQASYVTQRPFTILSRDNGSLSSNGTGKACTELLKPAIYSDSEKVSTCCTSGLISCELTLPKLIYYPGEAIIASVQVVNDSRSALSKVTARLVQNETGFSKTEPNKKIAAHNRAVVENELDMHVSGRNKKSWPNEFMLTIPSVPPSSDLCPILHISYELHIELAFSSRSSQILMVQAPLHIGSPMELSTPSTDVADGTATTTTTVSVDSKTATSLSTKPFKFVQCVFGPSVLELPANPSPMKRVEFTPLYPVLLG